MKLFIKILFLCFTFSGWAQVDSLVIELPSEKKHCPTKFEYKQLIAPITLISLGAIGRNTDYIKRLNNDIRNGVITNIHKKQRIDDFLQYVPVSQVFLLSNLGLKPRHSLKERLVLSATAYAIMAISVNTIKYSTKVLRPDNSALNSFPSGHTATAFTGLELLWQEYKDDSVWVGIIGYSLAVSTGALRVYNNRHWVTDVLTGAGIGILSAKMAYWLLPSISKATKISSEDKKTSYTLYPIYDSEMKGVGISFSF